APGALRNRRHPSFRGFGDFSTSRSVCRPMYRLDTSAPTPASDGAPVTREAASVLEFAILGLLHQSPMHGYELRKQLAEVLGGLRSISYGSLYPALKRMHAAGL